MSPQHSEREALFSEPLARLFPESFHCNGVLRFWGDSRNHRKNIP